MPPSIERTLLAPSSFVAADSTPLQRIEAAGFIPVPNPYSRRLTRDEVISLLEDDVVGLIAGLEPLDRGVLEGSRLKAICRVGSGMSNLDLGAARELGIVVHNTPDGPTEEKEEEVGWMRPKRGPGYAWEEQMAEEEGEITTFRDRGHDVERIPSVAATHA